MEAPYIHPAMLIVTLRNRGLNKHAVKKIIGYWIRGKYDGYGRLGARIGFLLHWKNGGFTYIETDVYTLVEGGYIRNRQTTVNHMREKPNLTSLAVAPWTTDKISDAAGLWDNLDDILQSIQEPIRDKIEDTTAPAEEEEYKRYILSRPQRATDPPWMEEIVF